MDLLVGLLLTSIWRRGRPVGIETRPQTRSVKPPRRDLEPTLGPPAPADLDPREPGSGQSGGNGAHVLTYLLVADLLQGLVALLWLSGLERLARPTAPRLRADLLVASLVAPPVVLLVGQLAESWFARRGLLLDASRWADALSEGRPEFQLAMYTLGIGALLLFVVQELPLVWRRRDLPDLPGSSPRLDRAVARLCEAFEGRPGEARILRLRWRYVDSDLVVAALQGLRNPTVVVTRGLIDVLDDDELLAVLAHEAAHRVAWGNLRTLAVWLVRGLQAASPAALVLFRKLLDVREQATDELAAKITGRPAALASALLKVTPRRPPPADGAGALSRARRTVAWRMDVQAARLRVRALLDPPPPRAQLGVRVVFVLVTLALIGAVR